MRRGSETGHWGNALKIAWLLRGRDRRWVWLRGALSRILPRRRRRQQQPELLSRAPAQTGRREGSLPCLLCASSWPHGCPATPVAAGCRPSGPPTRRWAALAPPEKRPRRRGPRPPQPPRLRGLHQPSSGSGSPWWGKPGGRRLLAGPAPPPRRAHHGVGAVQQADDGQQEPPPPVGLELGQPPQAALPQQARRLGALHRGAALRGWAGLGSARRCPAPPRSAALAGLPGAAPAEPPPAA